MSRWRTLAGLGPWWAVALVVAAGLAAVVTGHIRAGGYTMAGGAALAAVLRLVLSSPRSGGLVVRSRALDVVMLLVVGSALVVTFTMVRIPPVR